MLITHGIAGLWIAYGLIGTGFSMISPGLNAAATVSVDADEQGSLAGLLAAAPVFGMVVGPVAATLLYGVGAALPVALGAGITVVMAVLFARAA